MSIFNGLGWKLNVNIKTINLIRKACLQNNVFFQIWRVYLQYIRFNLWYYKALISLTLMIPSEIDICKKGQVRHEQDLRQSPYRSGKIL